MRAGAQGRAVCAVCELELEHCHGLVIRHADGSVECSIECGGGVEVHDAAILCSELSRPCTC